jgi:Tfp pilus assembly protein PilN
MAAMIKLQLDKFSPFPEEKMAFSYELLKTTESSSRVLIAAVHKDAIDFASAVCAHAGLDLQRIDAAMLGLGRVLADQGEIPAAGRQLLLLLEAEGGILLAAQAGALAAIKTIGSSSGLSAEEYAAEVVHEVGAFILALDLEQGVAPVNGLDFWQRDLAPDLLAERLQTELGQEARVRSLDALPAVSVGLARRMLRPPFKLAAAPGRQISAGVDLVPAVWRAAESARSVQRRIIAASILLLGLWLTAFLGFLGGYAWQQNALTTMEQRLKTLKDQADEVRAIQKRVRILEQYLDRKRSALECVGEISGLLPEGVTITGFQFKKAKNISLRGEALSVDPIYDFKQALDKSKLFTKIDLGSVTPSKRNNTTIQTFQMTIHQPEDQL